MSGPASFLLVVEDSLDDFELTAWALRRCGLAHELVHRETGDEALDFMLEASEGGSGHGLPELVILDLNLPGTDGREILREIKSDARLARIPVVVFTTSCDERDVESCYRAGANAYVQKPIGLERLVEVMGNVKRFWIDSTVLPGPTVRGA